MDKSILTECYGDTILIEKLIPTLVGYNKQHGCAAVANKVKEHNGFRLGIIDNDKRRIKYLDEFEEIDSIKNSLILMKHKDSKIHHYFILICPALEKWILEICEASAINLEDFEIGHSLEGLKKVTKSAISKYDTKLHSLFRQIKKLENSNLSVNTLIRWVTLLKEKNYIVTVEELKGTTD